MVKEGTKCSENQVRRKKETQKLRYTNITLEIHESAIHLVCALRNGRIGAVINF